MNSMQQAVDLWIKQYGIRYFNEMTNTLILVEEGGELARQMSRTYGEQSYKNFPDQDKSQEMIREELADIQFVLCCLANQMQIDLDAAMQESLSKKTKRDKDRHSKNPKLLA